ncbi:hypothetical protein [Nonomuraea maritima]|uniref:hypothetical protein n=1 Tax=Nonomuraea maritima TaxID=683260 RepID=UPI0037100508
MAAAIVAYTVCVALGALACLITWKLALRTRDRRSSERIRALQDRLGELQDEANNAKALADAYGDALNDIVDLADWSAGLSAARAIAGQALETGSYPGRLRAAQEALEQAEHDLHALRVDNVRLAELAVAPQ